jgi:methylmalonyl-CoA mutase N-terminal domain/subunit
MKKIDGLSTPDDLNKFQYEKDLGYPGEYPFTRGVYASMYRGRAWTMRQYSGFGDAGQTNQRFRYLLEQGQTGLSVAFDLPTQLGYDSDDPLSAGEVGRVGVAVSTLDDMAELFNKIPLDKVSTSMTINATAPILLAMLIVLAKRQGVSPAILRGTVQNDILKEYLARGNYIYPVTPSIRLTMDLWEYCMEHLPKWNMVSISGYHIREAGATASQELAFTFADAICYVEAAVSRGMDVDGFAPRISFFFGAHNNLLEEVAKFRAARRIWARLMKERFGTKNPKSWMLRFHTQTCGCTLTAQQPENNIVRVTLQALASVLGGTQSLHTNSYDEALALPSEKSSTIALRTQQIIAQESGVKDVIDALGGSYAVESMTNSIEAEVMEFLETIESQGGAIACLENGYMKREIEDSAYKYQKEIETKQQIVVGVNDFKMEERQRIDILKVSAKLENTRKKKLREYRMRRENKKVEESLEELKKAAQGDENLMVHIVHAVENEATMGEISNTLRGVFGTYDT